MEDTLILNLDKLGSTEVIDPNGASAWIGLIGIDYQPNHYSAGHIFNNHEIFNTGMVNAGTLVTNQPPFLVEIQQTNPETQMASDMTVKVPIRTTISYRATGTTASSPGITFRHRPLHKAPWVKSRLYGRA